MRAPRGAFAPIRPLLGHLDKLCVYGSHFSDLDPTLCGDGWGDLLDKVQAHFADAEFQSVEDPDCPEPAMPESVRLIDALSDLTEWQLATVAAGLGIKPADLPLKDPRSQAAEIYRRAGLDRSQQRVQLLRSLILKYIPDPLNLPSAT
jgi:hypothetical protein